MVWLLKFATMVSTTIKYADMMQLTTEVEFDVKHNATEEVEFKAGPGWLQNPDEVGEKTEADALRVALGLACARLSDSIVGRY